jgi:hypothetical protein
MQAERTVETLSKQVSKYSPLEYQFPFRKLTLMLVYITVPTRNSDINKIHYLLE